MEAQEYNRIRAVSSPAFDRLAFTVLAIEASAKKMGISPSEMRRRCLPNASRSRSWSPSHEWYLYRKWPDWRVETQTIIQQLLMDCWMKFALEFISDQMRRELPGLCWFSKNSLKNRSKFYEVVINAGQNDNCDCRISSYQIKRGGHHRQRS